MGSAKASIKQARHRPGQLTRKFSSVLFLLALGASHASPPASSPSNTTGANIDEAEAKQLIFVTPASSMASDTNPGTMSLPVKTIGRASSLALSINAHGVGSKIVIAAGVYRETIHLPASATKINAPIIFEAAVSGQAIISGSDVWTGWSSTSINHIYTHAWPYEWGLAPYPKGWFGQVKLSDIVRRREMIFVNGQSFTQVLSLEELVGGTFLISEPTKLVYLCLPKGLLIGNTLIEVSTRHPLFSMEDRSNVILRGLVFEHANVTVGEGGAVVLNNSSNVLVQHCAMRWNNYEGFSVAAVSHLSVDDSIINFNGGLGFGAWTISSSNVSDTETSYNNWRGLRGDFTDWDPSGTKILLARDVYILRHRASHNSARGLWLDTDNVNVFIKDSSFNNNLVDGVFIEASQGPVSVTHSVLSNNGQRGVLLGNSSNGKFENNIVYGNGECQFLISGTPSGRWIQDRVTGTVYPALQSINWAVNGNTFMGRTAQQLLAGTTLPEQVWRTYISSSEAAKNQWFNAESPLAFEPAGGGRLNLESWQRLTKLDLTSIYGDPRFAAPDQNSFTRVPDAAHGRNNLKTPEIPYIRGKK